MHTVFIEPASSQGSVFAESARRVYVTDQWSRQNVQKPGNRCHITQLQRHADTLYMAFRLVEQMVEYHFCVFTVWQLAQVGMIMCEE